MLWSKRCVCCQYMKNNALFRSRIYNSTHFNHASHESVRDVLEDMNPVYTLKNGKVVSVSYAVVLRHLRDHKFAELSAKTRKSIAERRIELEKKTEAQVMVQKALEGEALELINSKEPHVAALDTIISQGRDMLLKSQIKLKSSDILAAIKIKADIEKGQKDRTADLIKTLAGIAAPKQ